MFSNFHSSNQSCSQSHPASQGIPATPLSLFGQSRNPYIRAEKAAPPFYSDAPSMRLPLLCIFMRLSFLFRCADNLRFLFECAYIDYGIFENNNLFQLSAQAERIFFNYADIFAELDAFKVFASCCAVHVSKDTKGA